MSEVQYLAGRTDLHLFPVVLSRAPAIRQNQVPQDPRDRGTPHSTHGSSYGHAGQSIHVLTTNILIHSLVTCGGNVIIIMLSFSWML